MLILRQRKEEIINMLNSTFIDEPDTSDERREAIEEHTKTVDKADQDSEFISDWI